MNQYGYRGDFKGFTFNNIHSSTLGLTRVSDGSRYNENLTPAFKDITIDRQGADGKIFMGSNFTKREISVSFVFHNLTEKQLRRIQRVWNDKKIHELIFDEEPYKVYSAKITSTATMKYIAFEGEETHYRGEGSLTFTCFYPYAHSRFLYQEDYTVDNIHEWVSDNDYYVLLQDAALLDEGISKGGLLYYGYSDNSGLFTGGVVGNDTEFDWVIPQSLLTDASEISLAGVNSSVKIRLLDNNSAYINKNEWIVASGIPSNKHYGAYQNGQIKMFNAGDIEMPLKLWFALPTEDDIKMNLIIELYENADGGDPQKSLRLTNIQRLIGLSPRGAGRDKYIVVDMVDFHVEGYDEYNRPTGRLYDRYITNGNFYHLPLGECVIKVDKEPIKIEGSYLYL